MEAKLCDSRFRPSSQRHRGWSVRKSQPSSFDMLRMRAGQERHTLRHPGEGRGPALQEDSLSRTGLCAAGFRPSPERRRERGCDACLPSPFEARCARTSGRGLEHGPHSPFLSFRGSTPESNPHLHARQMPLGPGIESRDDKGGGIQIHSVIPAKAGNQRRDVHRARRVFRSADASHWIPDQVGNDDESETALRAHALVVRGSGALRLRTSP